MFPKDKIVKILNMNKALKDMLIGVLLGDAHIRKSGLDKAYITFEQSKKKLII